MGARSYRRDQSPRWSRATLGPGRGSSTRGVPWGTTPTITVHQHTPSLVRYHGDGQSEVAHLGTLDPGAHRWDHPAGACGETSVQVRSSRSGSKHCQRRFIQVNRAGRAKHGRSRVSTTRRSLASVRTPQPGHRSQPELHTSSGLSRTSKIRNPSSPSSAWARPVASVHRQRCSLSRSSNNSNNVGTSRPSGPRVEVTDGLCG
jgi:hypothetical protein